jgi:hypothetical protein
MALECSTERRSYGKWGCKYLRQARCRGTLREMFDSGGFDARTAAAGNQQARLLRLLGSLVQNI